MTEENLNDVQMYVDHFKFQPRMEGRFARLDSEDGIPTTLFA